MKKILYGVIGVLVVIFLIGTFAGGDNGSKSTSDTSKTEKTTGTNNYSKVGDTVKDDYFDVTVNSVDVVNSKKTNDFELIS